MVMAPRLVVATTVLSLLVGCGSPRLVPAGRQQAVPSSASEPSAPPQQKAAREGDVWLGGLPRGAPPSVGYVVDGVHVAADGTRTPLRPPPLGRAAPHVLDFTALTDGSFLVQQDNNFEGYTGLHLLRHDEVVDQWSTTGFVTGPGGSAAFAEATSSEASDPGPVAVHLLTGGDHLVQPLGRHPHPSVVAVDGRKVGFALGVARRSPRHLLTDFVGAPRPWRPWRAGTTGRPPGPVPARSYVQAATQEASGAWILLLGELSSDRRALSALVRRRVDGALEVAAPPRARPVGSLMSSAYVLDRRHRVG
jgi:hypothetical protein